MQYLSFNNFFAARVRDAASSTVTLFAQPLLNFNILQAVKQQRLASVLRSKFLFKFLLINVPTVFSENRMFLILYGKKLCKKHTNH